MKKVILTTIQNGQAVSLKDLILVAKDWMKEEEGSSIRAADVLAMPEVTVDFVKDKVKELKQAPHHPELAKVRKKLEECTREMQLLKNECGEGQREIDRLKREIIASQRANATKSEGRPYQFGTRQAEPPRCWHCGSDHTSGHNVLR